MLKHAELEINTNMADRPSRQAKKSLAYQRMMMREQQRNKMKEVRRILKKSKFDLTKEEAKLLDEHSNVVQEIQQRIEKHRCLSERMKEVIDPPNVVESKCLDLANALRSSSSVVVYTGAGISTAAKIPDYRGPEGVWTFLRKGKNIEVPDLSVAEPTFTHMAIKQLLKKGIIKHVVSQNCDGLHLRSGVPPKFLSEIHGNMFIEVCTKCKPPKQYVRLFDVTENTGLHRHYTGRFCKKCGSELKDTIVHFGETGKIPWPLNWKGAAKASADADVILCLGSSLKVLKRYPCLWATNRPLHKRPKLFIVNLQWTPKDTQCTLKIHAKCDDVMKHLTSILDVNVPVYCKEDDPIFQMATPLTAREKSSTTRKDITLIFPLKKTDVSSQESEHCYAKDEMKSEFCSSDVCHTSGTATWESDSKPSCPPESESNNLFSHLLQSDDCVIKLEEDHAETSLKRSVFQVSGWYGKGCAKWRKTKRKRL